MPPVEPRTNAEEGEYCNREYCDMVESPTRHFLNLNSKEIDHEQEVIQTDPPLDKWHIMWQGKIRRHIIDVSLII